MWPAAQAGEHMQPAPCTSHRGAFPASLAGQLREMGILSCGAGSAVLLERHVHSRGKPGCLISIFGLTFNYH